MPINLFLLDRPLWSYEGQEKKRDPHARDTQHFRKPKCFISYFFSISLTALNGNTDPASE